MTSVLVGLSAEEVEAIKVRHANREGWAWHSAAQIRAVTLDVDWDNEDDDSDECHAKIENWPEGNSEVKKIAKRLVNCCEFTPDPR